MEIQSIGLMAEDESRVKRRASTDEWTSNKKRALSSTAGSPIAANGVVDDVHRGASHSGLSPDEPEKEVDLERFRKAAIFRRMRHYQREYGRAHERIRHLEGALRQANLDRAEAESCWSSTMNTIRMVTQLEVLLAETGDNLKTVFPSRVFSSEDFRKTRNSTETKVQAAEKAINAFVKLAGKVDRPKYDELFSEYQELQQSSLFLTAEAEQTYALLEDTRKDRDKYLEELRIVQGKVDRLQSQVLHPELDREQSSSAEEATKVNGDVKMEGTAEGSGIKKEDSPSAEMQPPVSAANEPQIYGDQELQIQIQERDDRILALERENAFCRDQVVMAKSEINLLPEDVIAKTPTYRVLLDHASKKEAQLDEERQEFMRAKDEILMLQQTRTSWQEEIQAAATKESTDAKLLLKKRDDDLNRLRQQRDQLDSQLKELKATHDGKWSSINKYKALAESRGERIALLSSEIQRLRGRLAAADGNEDLLSFLCNNADINTDYVEDIKKRLDKSERELNSLRVTIQDSDEGLNDIASLREELDSAKKQLEAQKSSDASDLTKQLQAKEEELRVMKVKETQNTQETNALFAELDKLSLAWEALDKQLHAQVISLEKWEEEREKLAASKARADNKYYKMMSDFDAKDGERKQALRNLEKQTKLVETLQKSEKALQALAESLEKELATDKKALVFFRFQADKLEKDQIEARSRCEEESRRNNELRAQMQKREHDVAEINIAMLKLKDEVRRAKKEAEKAQEKSKTFSMPAASASARETRLQDEINKCMSILKCSTCHNAMRSTVITKCMHSFCKACVDARISHRQRKCPACNLAFAQSDVQTLYFQ
ncbi:hypothetical protein DFH11DRAFT_1501929 [Phellopilus nigrolimitatus]|nr:hypothetical protein DFH11DRAFT_1501929 [Phellopilus nigrolimitatus]